MVYSDRQVTVSNDTKKYQKWSLKNYSSVLQITIIRYFLGTKYVFNVPCFKEADVVSAKQRKQDFIVESFSK